MDSHHIKFDFHYYIAKSNYSNASKGQSLILKPPPHPTVMKDLAFNGSTFYRDNFIKHTLSKDKFAIYSNRS